MNGWLFLAAYLLIGIGISLTTAPPKTQPWARVAMVPGWGAFFLVALLVLAFGEREDL